MFQTLAQEIVFGPCDHLHGGMKQSTNGYLKGNRIRCDSLENQRFGGWKQAIFSVGKAYSA
ncbi:hypothetical protein DRA42_00790 [Ethanoligenens harbinense]|nr:hypothetical protein CXQ68_00775 [Ethanoligenens harbinense YUAN-3]AYF37602.1 hypothetical protein CXP51_00780 [Ethanoligenens harbinense]AYF40322.1 hypothetical protein CN246_00775 [Ethanoligenens harbinense]QCN91158.1 hypothetical protein DRA42_00790 [Ethanoligenens harbinense]